MKSCSCINRVDRAFVAPLAGAWIEIKMYNIDFEGCKVAPLAGAWIEILRVNEIFNAEHVAPLAGAWIEIAMSGIIIIPRPSSLPLRERGLK